MTKPQIDIERGSEMIVIEVKTTAKEKELIEKYASRNGMTVSAYIKETVLARIEDAYDNEMSDSAYQDYLEKGKEATSLEDLMDDNE